MGMIFGVRSRFGTTILECDPFQEGAEIPLAEGEELFCYQNEEELAFATTLRDAYYSKDLRPWWKRFFHIND